MAYTNQEIIEARKATDSHLEKAHEFFFKLKQKADKNKPLTDLETFHFCDFEWIGTRKNIEGFNFDKYQICQDYWFRDMYKDYWYDLDGLEEHIDIVTNEKYSKSRMKNDLEKLNEIASQWQETVNIENHSERLLLESSQETRREINKLKLKPEFNEYGFFRDCFRFKRALLVTLLRSKVIYLTVKDLLNRSGKNIFKYSLGAQEIELTGYSFIHIFHRHYEFSQKQVEREKSFHNHDIFSRDIPSILEKIFSYVTQEVAEKLDKHKIFFNYKKQNYTIWVNSKFKQKKGITENIPYKRIGSFYPTEDEKELDIIKYYYNLVRMDDDVSIYLKKDS